MLGPLAKLWRKRDLSDFDAAITRERLIQAGRIAIIDDESPLIIEDLKKSGFSVDHDRTGDDMRNYDSQIYDVAIVDYHGVGKHMGEAQGLELVKHIRRVSPRTRIIAHTSRSLSAAESEFFRLSHAVLPKDLGLGDSLALIEGELRKAFSKEHLFEALLAKLSVSEAGEREKMRKALVDALAAKNENGFRTYVTKAVGAAAEKSVEIIVAHLFSMVAIA